jgi:hypothetical protein
VVRSRVLSYADTFFSFFSTIASVHGRQPISSGLRCCRKPRIQGLYLGPVVA